MCSRTHRTWKTLVAFVPSYLYSKATAAPTPPAPATIRITWYGSNEEGAPAREVAAAEADEATAGLADAALESADVYEAEADPV